MSIYIHKSHNESVLMYHIVCPAKYRNIIFSEKVDQALNDIDHSKTKVKNPQSNGICERFQRTVLDEFYRVAFKKKIYIDLENFKESLTLGLTSTIKTARIRVNVVKAKHL